MLTLSHLLIENNQEEKFKTQSSNLRNSVSKAKGGGKFLPFAFIHTFPLTSQAY